MRDAFIHHGTLSSIDWRTLRREHQSAICPLTSNYRCRRARGALHPVYDFLFSYYTFSSQKLEQWHPGLGVILECEEPCEDAADFQPLRYTRTSTGFTLDPAQIREKDLKQLRWVRDLSLSILNREPRFSCFGLHEWAMVYRSSEIRHEYPLRLSPDDIASVVKDSTLCCSHFDAFRFFTPAASPLNIVQPTSDGRLSNEQAGCIHANMDLYKWAYKLYPLISSSLIRACFLLALRSREIDMRASPYDLSALGFEPICIETVGGREHYRTEQQSISRDAQALRAELHRAAVHVLNLLGHSSDGDTMRFSEVRT